MTRHGGQATGQIHATGTRCSWCDMQHGYRTPTGDWVAAWWRTI